MSRRKIASIEVQSNTFFPSDLLRSYRYGRSLYFSANSGVGLFRLRLDDVDGILEVSGSDECNDNSVSDDDYATSDDEDEDVIE